MLTVTEMTRKQAINKENGGYGQAKGSWNAAEATGWDHVEITKDPAETMDWDNVVVTMNPAVTK